MTDQIDALRAVIRRLRQGPFQGTLAESGYQVDLLRARGPFTERIEAILRRSLRGPVWVITIPPGAVASTAPGTSSGADVTRPDPLAPVALLATALVADGGIVQVIDEPAVPGTGRQGRTTPTADLSVAVEVTLPARASFLLFVHADGRWLLPVSPSGLLETPPAPSAASVPEIGRFRPRIHNGNWERHILGEACAQAGFDGDVVLRGLAEATSRCRTVRGRITPGEPFSAAGLRFTTMVAVGSSGVRYGVTTDAPGGRGLAIDAYRRGDELVYEHVFVLPELVAEANAAAPDWPRETAWIRIATWIAVVFVILVAFREAAPGNPPAGTWHLLVADVPGLLVAIGLGLFVVPMLLLKRRPRPRRDDDSHRSVNG
jgi:hypothetical protein